MSDIAKLMATDPLALTREDISAIVEEMRSARANFKTAGATKAPKEPKQSTVEKAGLSLDLDGLL